ncbi:PhnD/SsuA/transferrin family substrate-binding protein [Thermoleptolyngbya sp. C42_A2020_037]|uniref:phosphate/phosphite/phosphonate ABC transporter substrate-binding protein n=1 Tax=Thermoleptolyngbya sp. C42_A2020_037 TaxID=2747799 RepID=UPI0019ECF9C0|nr:PhnD/SsuA/transferrin family substrate-binding protein [Thermoleptolyngbya sp. C42_A2020_037]MBF2083884.1 PhnD/SsuA/transferrin family substrate-binding protein [Thermoleptolyngbya sp. C42_A2020_037]
MKRRNFLWYSSLFIAGCSATSTASRVSTVKLPKKIRFAITDVQGIDELKEKYDPFRAALEDVLETSVEFFPMDDLLTAASALQTNQLDLVWAGPSEYVTIHARTQATPLVSLIRSNYYAVLVVRANSGIQSLADLKGKTVDMWKVGSTASHLAGTKMLMDAGLTPQVDYKAVMTGENDLQSLRLGEVDACVRGNPRYRAALKALNASEQDYPIVARGELLPGDVFVLSSAFSSAVGAEIQARMLREQNKLLQGIRSVESLAVRFPEDSQFSVANDADYDMIREAYRAIGQDKFL